MGGCAWPLSKRQHCSLTPAHPAYHFYLTRSLGISILRRQDITSTSPARRAFSLATTAWKNWRAKGATTVCGLNFLSTPFALTNKRQTRLGYSSRANAGILA